jgi:hypothetical protein
VWLVVDAVVFRRRHADACAISHFQNNFFVFFLPKEREPLYAPEKKNWSLTKIGFVGLALGMRAHTHVYMYMRTQAAMQQAMYEQAREEEEALYYQQQQQAYAEQQAAYQRQQQQQQQQGGRKSGHLHSFCVGVRDRGRDGGGGWGESHALVKLTVSVDGD